MLPNGHSQKAEVDADVAPRLADFGIAMPVPKDIIDAEWIRNTRWRATERYMSPVGTSLHPQSTSLSMSGTTLRNSPQPSNRRQNQRLGHRRNNAQATDR
jgi:hypothetical protein